MDEEITQMCWSLEDIAAIRLEEEQRELAELIAEQERKSGHRRR